MSIPKSRLTHYMGYLSPEKLNLLDNALAAALDLYGDELWSG